MNQEERIRYWVESSNSDAQTMHHLFESGDFSWSLFIGHIVIEKLLKAQFVKNKDETPPILHDLSRIAQKAGLELGQDRLDLLDTMTTFNIRARYDDYKNEFALRCTREYASVMIGKIEELRAWIKSRL